MRRDQSHDDHETATALLCWPNMAKANRENGWLWTRILNTAMAHAHIPDLY